MLFDCLFVFVIVWLSVRFNCVLDAEDDWLHTLHVVDIQTHILVYI